MNYSYHETYDDTNVERDYRAKLLNEKQSDYLNGSPSDTAYELHDFWKNISPEDKEVSGTDELYRLHEFDKRKAMNAANRLGKAYGVNFSVGVPPCPKNTGTFGISIGCSGSDDEPSINVTDLSLDEFKNLYRDLGFLKLSLTMHYRTNDGEYVHISDSQLGSLRNSHFPELGIEKREDIENELMKAGLSTSQNADFLNLETDRLKRDQIGGISRKESVLEHLVDDVVLSKEDAAVLRALLANHSSDDFLTKFIHELVEEKDGTFLCLNSDAISSAINAWEDLPRDLRSEETLHTISRESSEAIFTYMTHRLMDGRGYTPFAKAFRSAYRGELPDDPDDYYLYNSAFTDIVEEKTCRLLLESGRRKAQVLRDLLMESPFVVSRYGFGACAKDYARDFVNALADKIAIESNGTNK